MTIMNELLLKIEEMRGLGMTGDDIRKDGLIFLKRIISESSFQRRKEFFLHIERDNKLKLLLDE